MCGMGPVELLSSSPPPHPLSGYKNVKSVHREIKAKGTKAGMILKNRKCFKHKSVQFVPER